MVKIKFNESELCLGIYVHNIVEFELDENETEEISSIDFSNKQITKRVRIIVGFLAGYVEIII